MVERTSIDSTVKPSSTNTVKFLCSYGGKILPRHPDGKLRYIGGETRVLSVDRSITFTDLSLKLQEVCGSSVNLRCQLPQEDLDALVSITCDEDLANVIEEYDRVDKVNSTPSKIRAFLSPKSIKKTSPSSSSVSSSIKKTSPPASITDFGTPKYSVGSKASFLQRMAVNRCVRQILTPVGYPVAGTQMRYYACAPRGNPANCYLVHNGNHWQ